MTNLRYEIGIEYGPTAADIHYVTVTAGSPTEAMENGRKWALDNGIQNAMINYPLELSDTDNLIDDIEWTSEEEEEFIRMISNRGID